MKLVAAEIASLLHHRGMHGVDLRPLVLVIILIWQAQIAFYRLEPPVLGEKIYFGAVYGALGVSWRINHRVGH